MRHLAAAFITVSIIVGAFAPASAVTLVRNDFVADAEGWAAYNGVSSRRWLATGGHPDGFVQATDGGADRIFAFVAPAAWLGDQSAAVGGALSWAMKVSTLAHPMSVPWSDVKIGGGGLVLAGDAGVDPGLDWTVRSISFAPGAWRLGEHDGPVASAADIAAVLANVEFMHLRGEFSGAARDTTSLDTVVMTAVPELSSSLLALAGLAALGLARGRRARG
jgi:Laminin B (Domain IV)